MTKQEFLAFSLPYELHGIILNRVALINGIEYEKELPITWKGERFTGKCGFNIKPILHPLTDLTKEIEYKGEKFIPIDKLYHLDIMKCDISSFEYISLDVIADHVYRNQSLKFILKLVEWHFDIAKLIDKGEAIDVNTLDENPYK